MNYRCNHCGYQTKNLHDACGVTLKTVIRCMYGEWRQKIMKKRKSAARRELEAWIFAFLTTSFLVALLPWFIAILCSIPHWFKDYSNWVFSLFKYW